MGERRKAKWKLWLMAGRDSLLMSKGLLTSCQTSKSSLSAFRVQTQGVDKQPCANSSIEKSLDMCWKVLQIDRVGKSQNLSHGFGNGDHGENQGPRMM
jgi:hypothetical protein